MPLHVKCSCGTTVEVPDQSDGTPLGCPTCRNLLPLALPAKATRRPRLTVVEEEDDDDLPPSRSRTKKKAYPRKAATPWGLIAGIGIGALALLLLIGVAVYYFGFSKSTSEEQLVGDWEMDPEPVQQAVLQNPFGAGFMPLVTMSFRKDHTYKLNFMIEMEGRWSVVSRDGNKLKVKMVMSVFGLDQDNPPTATITMIDKDHLQFDANEKSMQMQGRFRRVGTGSSGGTAPANPAVALPALKGGIDAGMTPDCDVLWNGQWYPAKILKAEKDRWLVHYIGFLNNWDEWVGKDRIRLK
jgi:hypothetical protein